MKTFSTSLAAALAAPVKEPRYLFRFSHVASLSSFDFAADFTTGDIKNATQTYYQAAGFPTGNTQTVEVEQGRSTIGTFRIPFYDLDGAMTRYMSSPPAGLSANLNNSTTTVAASIAGGLAAAYPPFGVIFVNSERMTYTTRSDSQFTGVVRGAQATTAASHTAPSSLGNGNQIRVGEGVQIFVGDTTVAFSAYASLVYMQVAERVQSEPGVYEVVVQDFQRELKKFAFLDAAPDTTSATNTLTRQGNPLTLLLQVWTTTSGGGNSAYDQGDGRGAHIPQRFIEVASIEALRTQQFPNDVYTFLFREPILIKDWSESLLKTLNCYTFVTNSGTLSVKRIATSGTTVASLTMDTIVGVPQWQAGDRLIANHITFLYDFGGATPGQFGTRELFVSQQSVEKYGRRPTAIIEGFGVRTANSGSAVALDRATRFFERFADPPPVLQMDVHYSQLRLDIGDVVTVTHSWVPNLRTGTLGISGAVFEITDMRPILSPREGPPRVGLSLLHTGAADIPPPPSIGSSAGGTGGRIPGTPTSLTVTTSYRIAVDATFYGTVLASWTAPNDADLAGYMGRAREVGVVPYYYFALPNVTTLYVGDVVPGASFEMAVAAVNILGNQGAYSNTATFATPQQPAFTAPVSFQITTSLQAFPPTIALQLGATVTISWGPPVNAGVGIAGYMIRAREIKVPTIPYEYFRLPDEQSTQIPDYPLGFNVEVQIAGIDRSNRQGSYSNVVTFTTAMPGVFTAPRSFTITTSLQLAADGSLAFTTATSWSTPASAQYLTIAGYNLLARVVGDAFSTFTFPGTQTSHFAQHIYTTLTYEAKIAAFDQWLRIGSYTNVVTFAAPTLGGGGGSGLWIPIAPVTIAVGQSPTAVKVTWSANTETNVIGYQVWRATNSAMSTNSISAAIGLSTLLEDASLDPAQTYYYRLRARTRDGTVSSWSAMAFSTPGVVTSGGLSTLSVLTTNINEQAVTSLKRQLLSQITYTTFTVSALISVEKVFAHNLGIIPVAIPEIGLPIPAQSAFYWVMNRNDTANTVISFVNLTNSSITINPAAVSYF